MKKILKKAFSAQNRTSYVHDKEDNVVVFGAVSAVISLVTGAFFFLFFVVQDVDIIVRSLGLLWMIYSGLILVGLELFERTKKKEAAVYLAILGLVGVLLGVGFFLGGILTLITGCLALKYHYASKN